MIAIKPEGWCVAFSEVAGPLGIERRRGRITRKIDYVVSQKSTLNIGLK
jgi:hypothetical protein